MSRLNEWAERIWSRRVEIQRWFQNESEKVKLPLFCSIDLRDSGDKIAPVDNNLFPGGFHHICNEDILTLPAILKRETQARDLGSHVLLVPEFHTQNKFYWDNVKTLSSLLEAAGHSVKLGWPSGHPHFSGKNSVEILSDTLGSATVYAYENLGGRLYCENFEAQWVLLNNDLSGGPLESLANLNLPIVPSQKMGWFQRRKSTHFLHYNRLATEFSNLAGIDPFCFTIETKEISEISFSTGEGIDRLYQASKDLYEKLIAIHEQKGISYTPSLFIKNSAGTYGMGIMHIDHPDEIQQMNRRTKNKMSVGKNSRSIDSVIVQESIPTRTLVDRLPSEPVIYTVGGEWVGGFLRTNSQRSNVENLNSAGMVFRKLCMKDLRECLEGEAAIEDRPNLEWVYGSIASLSALAAGHENS